MLSISQPAQDRLRALTERQFLDKLARFLRREVPDLRRDPFDAVLREVGRQVARARGFGLTSERGVATYALTAAFLGLGFEERFPAAAIMLGAADVAEQAKCDWLERWSAEVLVALGR